MSASPTISVVIPAFNAEDYIERTLQSALNQTYKNIEVIVIDDGSTDSTLAIAEASADKDLRVRVFSVPNGGVAWARNHGIQRATGTFVAFLDADDLWHPTKLACQLAALTSGEGAAAAAVYTRMRIIDWEDRVIRNGGGFIAGRHTLPHHLYTRPVGNGSSLLVRRKVAEEVNGFDPSLLARGIGGCEDLDFELKIAARHPMVGLHAFLVGYRSHAANMSTQRLRLAASVLAVIDHHLQCHPELPSWAVRKISASTLEVALQNIAGMRRPDIFAKQALRLCRVDPYRGLTFGTRFLARKVVRPALAFVRPSAGGKRPHFYDLQPHVDGGSEGRSLRARDLRVLERLDRLDFQGSWSQPGDRSL